jgi:hypothetical protein
MKKFAAALKLFEKHVPDVEVQIVERTWKNWFRVTTSDNHKYTVDISTNKVERSYDDPED